MEQGTFFKLLKNQKTNKHRQMKDIYLHYFLMRLDMGRQKKKKSVDLKGPVAGCDYGEGIKEEERKNGSCVVVKFEEAKAEKNWLM